MKLPTRLKWVFAILFVASGAVLVLGDADAPRAGGPHLVAGVTTFFLGAFTVCLAWEAWTTGRISVQYFNYSRAAQPRRFRAAVMLVLAAGCGTLAAAGWFLFFQ